jgi:hypothetical protein
VEALALLASIQDKGTNLAKIVSRDIMGGTPGASWRRAQESAPKELTQKEDKKSAFSAQLGNLGK